ncbi:MAG TPA: efflux RND transporter periplasmic adaptor subunit [Polyangia bacterium]
MDDASPRFRQDLEASATEAEGVACVDVRDPKSGTSFRFYDFEYQLALQFTGQPLSAVTSWASEAYGVNLTVDGINEFAGRLSELGFLEAAARAEAPTAIGPDETPATGTAALDAMDSAEAEWMTTEGAQTATFIPDPGMLDSPADRTPVAPDLPTLDALAETDESSDVDVSSEEPTPGPSALGAKPAETETPPPAPALPARLFDIPMPAAKAPLPPAQAPTLPPLRSPAPGGASARPASSWATDLEGNLQPETGAPVPAAPPAMPASPAESVDGRTPPPLHRGPTAATVPSLPATANPAPAGLSERRQPPAPEAVQMASFAPDAGGAAASMRAKQKRGAGPIIAVIVLLLVIAGLAYVMVTREKARVPQAAARVRVLSPKPAAIYRWFSGRGTVTDHEARTLAFESAGTLAELLPPGTAFGTADILGRLRAAPPIEATLARQRARLAFYEQMRDSMRKANNQPELRQAEIKLAEKQRLIEESMAALGKVVVRAPEPGEVVETLGKVGTPVRANAPIVRVKGRMLHGEFALDGEEIARAGKLGFCRVEVVGLGPHASNTEAPAAGGTAADVGSPDAQAAPRFIDCTVEKSGAAAGKLRVALPDNLGLVPGQPLRLARERFDAVFPVPAGAVGGDDGHRSLWVATAAGRAERRDVTVADMSDDALVSNGLRVGDEVIVDAPAGLQPGAAIVVER